MSFRLTVLFVTGVLLAWGCVEEYDLKGSVPERGTLGEELHDQWVKDTRRGAVDPEERTELLENRREEFVSGVDRAVPEDKIGELNEVLLAFLPLVEDGYYPAVTRRVPGALDEAIADEELMEALEAPPPYRSSEFVAPGLRGQIFEEFAHYDRLAELTGYSGDLLLAHEGLDDDGEPQMGSPTGYRDLLIAANELADADPADHRSDRWGPLFRDLLTQTDSRYAEGGAQKTRRIALFDDRGVPVVRRDEQGDPMAPFVDNDSDGGADIDDRGRFVLDDGEALTVPPLSNEPIDHASLDRGAFGRVENHTGETVFRYLDVGNTALVYLLRTFGRLVERDVVSEVALSVDELFGPTVAAEDDRGTYRGYPEDHPLVDLFDAVISSAAIDELAVATGVLARWLDRHSDRVAHGAHAAGEAADVFAEDDGIDLADEQTLFYDQLDVMREITADPELFADVVDALGEPVVAHTGDAMTTLIEYRDADVVPEEDGPYNQCFYSCKAAHDIGTIDRLECIRDCPNDELFSEPTDFDADESPDNRSQYQRLFHLLRDTAGVPYELVIEDLQEPWLGLDAEDLPVMFRLPGAAEAFIRSVAGELYIGDYITEEFDDSALGVLVDLLENITGGAVDDDSVVNIISLFSSEFGTQLDPYPTPDQVTRLFNQSDLRIDYETSDGDIVIDITDPECKDGYVMADHLAEGLFTAEASGLIDAIYPLAGAFAKHDREDLLARLFVEIHYHYSGQTNLYMDADGNPSPMEGSNLVSAEPALQEVFDDGEFFRALRTIAESTGQMTDDEGVAVVERIRQLLHRLIRNDQGYRPRSEPFQIERPDGTVIDDPSRLEVIVDRLPELLDRIEDDDIRDRLDDAADELFDVVLSVEEIDDDHYEFRPEATVALISDVFRFLGIRAESLTRRGRFDDWFNEDAPQTFQDLISSRGFYAAMELVEAFYEDDQGRQLADDVSLYLTDDIDRSEHLAVAVYGLFVRLLDPQQRMPITRFVAGVFDPERQVEVEPHSEISNGRLAAMFMSVLPDYDEEGYFLDIVARGSRTGSDHDSTWGMLSRLLVRYFSSDPTGEGPLSRDDRADALRRIGDWFHDDLHGAERFYQLVEQRGNLELDDIEE